MFHYSLLVTVLHSIFNVADVPLKTVHFLQAGFDRNGERLLAVDQRGNVYVFDLIRNKYEMTYLSAQNFKETISSI